MVKVAQGGAGEGLAGMGGPNTKIEGVYFLVKVGIGRVFNLFGEGFGPDGSSGADAIKVDGEGFAVDVNGGEALEVDGVKVV